MARGETMARSGLNAEENERVLEEYWKRTVRFTATLIVVWFLVGYVIPVFLIRALNNVEFLGGPFGFWFAHNGAIYLFWLLILIYAVGMGRLDRQFDVHDLQD